MTSTKKAASKLVVTYRAIGELIPYARNSRTHSPEQVKQIAASIREFGFTNPVLIDGDNGIIAGHGRVMAAELLAMKQVPAITLAHLTEAQKRAYVIADNKLSLNAGWDLEMLAIEMADLPDGMIELTGFDPTELAGLLGDFNGPPDDDVDHKEEDLWPMFAMKIPPEHLQTLRDLLKGVTDAEAPMEWQKLFILLDVAAEK